MWKRVVGALLACLALAQVGVLWRQVSVRSFPSSSPAVILAPGDTVRSLRVQFENGRRGRYRLDVPDHQWTVVLSFRSDCAPSRLAAPLWRQWLTSPKPLRVVAVTRDSLPTALAYRGREGWPVQLLSVHGARRGSREHSLVTRTPWLFLIDPDGVVRYQGHGSTLAALDSVIVRGTDSPGGSGPR